MGETAYHVRAIHLLFQALEDFFRDRPDVFVAADMFWYWREGDPSAVIAPDAMVVPGVGRHDRRSFLSWEEGGAVPTAVFEMASQNTWREDLEEKFDRYEELGVREYFLFDPEGLYLVPVLQGFRLRGSAYRRLRSPDGDLESELGFKLRAEGRMLRLIDAATESPIPTRAERAELAEQERHRADQEKARADALQAEVERLKGLLKQYGHPNGGGGA
jgi:Uma2 family endonuclease